MCYNPITNVQYTTHYSTATDRSLVASVHYSTVSMSENARCYRMPKHYSYVAQHYHAFRTKKYPTHPINLPTFSVRYSINSILQSTLLADSLPSSVALHQTLHCTTSRPLIITSCYIYYIFQHLLLQLGSNIHHLLQLRNRFIGHVQWLLCLYFSIPCR